MTINVVPGRFVSMPLRKLRMSLLMAVSIEETLRIMAYIFKPHTW
jgi:hypothetical protein